MKHNSYLQKLFVLLVFFLSIGESFAWKPVIIGHRGSRTGVENTEQAFIQGITKHGCQALECDVKVTSDKKYVCWHDDIISGFGLSSNCTIYSTTLATLQSKTLTQTRKSVKYTGKITTVDRYLEICKQYNVIPVVELKWEGTYSIRTKGADDPLLCIITAEDMSGIYENQTQQVLISWKGMSFDEESNMFVVNDCNFQLSKK